MSATCSQCCDCNSFFTSLESSYDRSYTVLNVNIHSIRKYWDQFLALINASLSILGVIILTEINISVVDTPRYAIPGFSSYFATCSHGRGVGIAVFVKDS